MDWLSCCFTRRRYVEDNRAAYREEIRQELAGVRRFVEVIPDMIGLTGAFISGSTAALLCHDSCIPTMEMVNQYAMRYFGGDITLPVGISATACLFPTVAIASLVGAAFAYELGDRINAFFTAWVDELDEMNASVYHLGVAADQRIIHPHAE